MFLKYLGLVRLVTDVQVSVALWLVDGAGVELEWGGDRGGRETRRFWR